MRFHPSQTDFILRSKISFAVRQISLRVPTRRGWAVGVAALWGYFINIGVEEGFIFVIYNTDIATNCLRREEPFRGIATARQTPSLLAMTYL